MTIMLNGQELEGFRFEETNSAGWWRLGADNYKRLLAAGWAVDPDYPILLDEADAELAFEVHHDLEAWFPSRAAAEASLADAGVNLADRGCDCCGAPFRLVAFAA